MMLYPLEAHMWLVLFQMRKMLEIQHLLEGATHVRGVIHLLVQAITLQPGQIFSEAPSQVSGRL